jgi:tRNA(fMet)-specific endonuclease VapC
MIILDTDHISLLQSGGEPAERIKRRLRTLGPDESFPTSIITYDEQMRGWMQRFGESKTVADDIRVYERLHAHIRFYSTVTIFDFNALAATEFQRLRHLRVRIGTMDLRIAAIALANDATVWTRNLVDFRKVPGLRVEDASV